MADCKIVLFPKDNIKDYNQAIIECPTLIDKNFKAIPIETFEEGLKYMIKKNQDYSRSASPSFLSRRPNSTFSSMVRTTASL